MEGLTVRRVRVRVSAWRHRGNLALRRVRARVGARRHRGNLAVQRVRVIFQNLLSVNEINHSG